MTEQIPPEVDPLLRPLGRAQDALLQIVGEAVTATGAWPVYQYVQLHPSRKRVGVRRFLRRAAMKLLGIHARTHPIQVAAPVSGICRSVEVKRQAPLSQVSGDFAAGGWSRLE